MIQKRIVKQFWSHTNIDRPPLFHQMQQEIDVQANDGYDLESWQLTNIDDKGGIMNYIIAVFIQVP